MPFSVPWARVPAKKQVRWSWIIKEIEKLKIEKYFSKNYLYHFRRVIFASQQFPNKTVVVWLRLSQKELLHGVHSLEVVFPKPEYWISKKNFFRIWTKTMFSIEFKIKNGRLPINRLSGLDPLLEKVLVVTVRSCTKGYRCTALKILLRSRKKKQIILLNFPLFTSKYISHRPSCRLQPISWIFLLTVKAMSWKI